MISGAPPWDAVGAAVASRGARRRRVAGEDGASGASGAAESLVVAARGRGARRVSVDAALAVVRVALAVLLTRAARRAGAPPSDCALSEIGEVCGVCGAPSCVSSTGIGLNHPLNHCICLGVWPREDMPYMGRVAASPGGRLSRSRRFRVAQALRARVVRCHAVTCSVISEPEPPASVRCGPLSLRRAARRASHQSTPSTGATSRIGAVFSPVAHAALAGAASSRASAYSAPSAETQVRLPL